MKPIILSPRKWNEISKLVYANQPTSVLLMRNVHRRELGFTVREHKVKRQSPFSGWTAPFISGQQPGPFISGPYVEIHLDFYDEAAQTMFILKYL